MRRGAPLAIALATIVAATPPAPEPATLELGTRTASARYIAGWSPVPTTSSTLPETPEPQPPPWIQAQPTTTTTAPPPAPTARNTARSRAPAPRAAEGWRDLVAAYFPADQVDKALAVMWCESRGDPGAYNSSSGASGLFQHLAKYWPERASKAGWGGADVFDPEANTAVAAWLQRTGGWGHWTCA